MFNITNAVYQRLCNNAGKIFLIKDFEDLANKSTIRSTLSRLTKQGKICRIVNGLYVKRQYSNFFKIYGYPLPYEIAEKIAEKHGWKLTISGNAALNQTGLDTQMQNSFIFCSTGKNCTYKYENCEIVFQHINPKYINNLSPEFAILLQAIRHLIKLKQKITEWKLQTLAEFRKKYIKENNILDNQYQFPPHLNNILARIEKL